jgi:hypothetical protein
MPEFYTPVERFDQSKEKHKLDPTDLTPTSAAHATKREGFRGVFCRPKGPGGQVA